MKIIQIVISFCLILYSKAVDLNAKELTSKDCKSLGHSIEERMRFFMFINSKPIIPIDEQTLKGYCDATKPITKELKEYRRCVDEFSKQVITIIMPNLIKSIKKVCVTNTESTIANMKCASKADQLVYKNCFENFAVKTKYIAYKLTKSEELLSGLCCNFHSLRNCLLTKLTSNCPNPKANLAKYLTDYVNAIGQEVVAFSCAKYQTIKVCEEQGIIKILNKYKASDVEKWKDEFFLIPLIKGTQMIIRN